MNIFKKILNFIAGPHITLEKVKPIIDSVRAGDGKHEELIAALSEKERAAFLELMAEVCKR